MIHPIKYSRHLLATLKALITALNDHTAAVSAHNEHLSNIDNATAYHVRTIRHDRHAAGKPELR